MQMLVGMATARDATGLTFRVTAYSIIGDATGPTFRVILAPSFRSPTSNGRWPTSKAVMRPSMPFY